MGQFNERVYHQARQSFDGINYIISNVQFLQISDYLFYHAGLGYK